MKHRLFGACGVLAVVALSVGNCKSDPLSDLDGVPTSLITDFSYLEVPIGDALPVTARVVDGRSSPLEVPITFRTCSGLVSVATDTSYHPVPPTSARVLVTGVSLGTSCVIAEGAGLADTVSIATFPKSIVLTSGPDTVISGVAGTYTYTFQFVDRDGNPVVGSPAPVWSVSDTLRATITAAGVLTARDTGLVDVIVTGVGTGTVTDKKSVVVRPAPFNIVITPNPADPGQVVKLARSATGPIFDANTSVRFGATVQTFVTGSLTPDSVKVAIPDLATGGALSVGAARLGPEQITQSPGALTVNTPAALAGSASPSSGIAGTKVVIKRTSGPAFDANTRVYFNGVRTLADTSTIRPDSIVAPVPGLGVVGPVELRITRMDVADLARRVTFNADTGVFKYADQYDAVNDDPATAPAITANGDYYVVLSGVCTDGVAGPGEDCDDFFKVTNSTAAARSVTVRADWLTASDVDILWCKNATCSGAGNVVTGGGATSANPEISTVTIPAGATWYLWINNFAGEGAASIVTRVRVSGLP
jgi:hypothetical protein